MSAYDVLDEATIAATPAEVVQRCWMRRPESVVAAVPADAAARGPASHRDRRGRGYKHPSPQCTDTAGHAAGRAHCYGCGSWVWVLAAATQSAMVARGYRTGLAGGSSGA